MPNTFVIAASKAGSTWLADQLKDHPDGYVPAEKEPHFFSDDRNWEKGLDWYLDSFYADTGGARIVVDGTPKTFLYPEALRRIKALVPDAKLLAILRDPPGRAYSNWRHVYYRTVTEHRTFAQLVEDEIAEDAPLPRADRCDWRDQRHLTEGRYAEHLERVLEVFPREQLHVVLLDDVRADPEATMAGVYRFLGIDPPPASHAETPANPHKEFRPVWLWRFLVRHRILKPFPPRFGVWVARRMSRTARTPAPMDPAVKQRLQEHYGASDARLAQLLGRDLPWTH
jgi:hypothetical protein